jgi:hypothetical protein
MFELSQVPRSQRSSLLSTLLLLSVMLGTTPLLAQSAEELAGARAAATEGVRAFNEARYAEAIDMMTRADSLVKSPVHKLYMARSYAKLGKLVRARELYIAIRREGTTQGASEAVRRAIGDAEKELQDLEPRLPYVTVAVQGAGPLPVTVTMDGVAIPQALVGVPHPIDPGVHAFQAFAEGKKSDEKQVNVAEASRTTVVLSLQEQSGVGGPGASGQPSGDPAPSQPDTTGPQATLSTADLGPSASSSNGLRIGSYVAIGVGVIGLGAGTFFLVDGAGKSADANKLFDANNCAVGCPDSVKAAIKSKDDEAASAKTLGAVGLIVGGASLATGITLFILSGKQQATASTLTPYVGLNEAGIVGRF